MKVYLASSDDREGVIACAEMLKGMGVKVVSTWHARPPARSKTEAASGALLDEREAARANVVVVFSDTPLEVRKMLTFAVVAAESEVVAVGGSARPLNGLVPQTVVPNVGGLIQNLQDRRYAEWAVS